MLYCLIVTESLTGRLCSVTLYKSKELAEQNKPAISGLDCDVVEMQIKE